ncbi:hypothetical protein C0991_007365 [Blastosporella zonata]|nr:hypothetical protein C0991_007365 [Blastosporella zonata]
MTRTLRPRKSNPSYVALGGIQDEGAGPSTRAVAFDDDVDSGSDFAPEKNADTQVEDDDDDDMEPDGEEEGPTIAPSISVTASRRSASVVEVKTKVVRGPSKPSLSRASKRQMYVLPTPSVHHRHRAVPLYTRSGRVERLETPPILFKAPKIVMSNNFTQNAKVADRVNKSWGYNVGHGPIWELVEDRGWYKEAVEGVPDMDSDANRRPRVHKNVQVKGGWEVLSNSDAAAFLPTDVVITEDGNLKPPPPLTCLLGPFGQQTEMKMEMFHSHKIAELIPESTGYVFNAGAPVWGIDWCPIHADDRQVHRFKQYLAVAPFPTGSHSPEIGIKVARPSHACIQIWSLGPTQPSPTTSPRAGRGKSKSKEVDHGGMKCEMVLCIESGPAHELKWCPLPSNDANSVQRRPRKLGLLSGVFEDGSWSIYAVPFPEDVRTGGDPSQPVYVKLPEPLLRIELEETSCWTFDWANSEQVAIGTTNGIIAVYNLGPHLSDSGISDSTLITDLLPTHYITVHQSAIRALAWIRAPPATSTGAPRTDGDPTVIASGGYDGMECMTDIREGHGSVMNRTRDVINAMAFSPYGGGPVTIDHENIVKAYSASPSMLGRGHTLLEPQGPVWSVNASDFHPQLAVGSADGCCTTTNSLRSTRRGGSVETQDRPATKAKAAKAAGGASGTSKEQERIKADSAGTGAWPQEVGVHRVIWNSCNGLAASGLLASSTGSGLCRVDELWGRWIKGKVPYGGIEHIRGEMNDDVMDVDDGASDDSAGSS